jgi:hypothetical protein
MQDADDLNRSVLDPIEDDVRGTSADRSPGINSSRARHLWASLDNRCAASLISRNSLSATSMDATRA